MNVARFARSVTRRLATADPARLCSARSVARRLATADPARLDQGSLGIQPSARPRTGYMTSRQSTSLCSARSVARQGSVGIQPSALPRAGYMTSRQFSTLPSPDESEKYKRLLFNISAALGCVAVLSGMLGAAAYYVISTVNHGVEEKLRAEKEANAVKIEAEKTRGQEFESLASQTHMDSFRKMHETVADLRAQLHALAARCLERQALEEFYRSQISKAQAVLDREGVTSSAEVQEQLLPKISNLQDELDYLTEKVAKLRSIAQKYPHGGAAAASGTGDNEKSEAASDLKDSAAATRLIEKSDVSTVDQKSGSEAEVSSPAGKEQDGKRDAPTVHLDAGSPEAKNRKPQDGGGSGSV